MAESKQSTTVRLEPELRRRLDTLAEHWHVSQSDVLAHGVGLLTDPDLGPVLGDAFQSAEQGLRAWAALVERASADNEKAFGREEWNLMADANNGCSPLFYCAGDDFRAGMPLTMVWANVEDAARLEGAGEKWFAHRSDGRPKALVAELVKKLRALDYAHGWAVAVALQWFWAHPESIDHTSDVWWTLAFRRRKAGGSES